MSALNELRALKLPKGAKRARDKSETQDNKAAVVFLAPWLIGFTPEGSEAGSR